MPKTHVSSGEDLDTFVAATKDQGIQPIRKSIWEPLGNQNPEGGAVAIPIEEEVIRVITTPIAAGERHREGNDRKERELAALLDTLSPLQNLTLDRRLANRAAGDALVAAFDRLAVERRLRLLSHLARRRTIAVTLARRA